METKTKTCTFNPSISNLRNPSLLTRTRLVRGILAWTCAVLPFRNRKLPSSLQVGSTWTSCSRAKRAGGRQDSKDSSAQWMVIPHPWPRAVADASRSKRVNEMSRWGSVSRFLLFFFPSFLHTLDPSRMGTRALYTIPS